MTLDQTAADERYRRLTESVVSAVASTLPLLPDPGYGQTMVRVTLNQSWAPTFPIPVAGRSFLLVLIQDGTGGWTFTAPANVVWEASAPTVSAAPGSRTYLRFVCVDGVNWSGRPTPGGTPTPVTPGILTVINVKTDYGAAGDGTADDTTAITNALAAVPTGGGVVYFPPGVYKTTGGFTLSHPTTILGAGAGNGLGVGGISIIQCTSATATLFTVTGNGCRFERIVLRNTSGTTPTAGAGIAVTGGGDGTRYESITVDNFYINVDQQYGAVWFMNSCYLYGAVQYNLKIQNIAAPDGGDMAISNTVFMAGNGTRIPAAQVRYESGGGLRMVNCKTNAQATANQTAIGIDLAVSGTTQTSICYLANCSLEGFQVGATAVRVASTTSTAHFNCISIVGCEVGSAGSTFKAVDVSATSLGAIMDVLIDGCIFQNYTPSSNYAINLNTVQNATIGGNVTVGFAGQLTQTGCANVTVLTGASAAYQTVQDEGTALTQRSVVDFVGAGVTATDDSTNARTVVTIPGGTAGVGELLMTNGVTNPPVPVTTEDGTDWLYQG